MYPKTHLHLNSKQSGQLAAALLAASVVQYVFKDVKIRRTTRTHELDNVLIKEDPRTGLVTALTVYKDGRAKQYTWNHRR